MKVNSQSTTGLQAIKDSSSSSSKLKNFFNYIWPIKRHELPKFFTITLLMFCILFIQNLIRAQKDSIIIPMIGAEAISFLKFWGVMPSAFLFMILYVKLVNILRAETIFYLILSIFLIFFAFFAYYIFPHHHYLHLNTDTAASLITLYPNFKWFILLLSNWSFSLFYIIAELWPNAVFALLFWQFVNKFTTIDESKRFYLLFGLFGQTGLYISGSFLQNLPLLYEYFSRRFSLNIDDTTFSIQITLTLVLLLGVTGIFAFWLLNNLILRDKAEVKLKVKKASLGLKDSFKMILSSKYILLIAVMLFSYGAAINLVEGPWKNTALSVYPKTIEYSAFIGGYLKYTGLVTIPLILIGSSILLKFGWFATAIITPLMLFITGISFFLVANFDHVRWLLATTSLISDPLMLAVTIGIIQNVLSKSTKYTLFDATKEMSYVPLEDELKTKGKAAADMVGTKLGKSASAFLQSMVFIIWPSTNFQSISLYLMCIFCVICLIWVWAIKQLSKEYNIYVQSKHETTPS